MRELEAQAKFLAPVIAAAVAKAVTPLQERIAQLTLWNEDLTKRLDGLPEPIAPDLEAIAALVPVPQNGKDAEQVDLQALANEVMALVPVPKDGEPGKDAQPVDLQAVAALVEVPKAEPIDLEALAIAAAALIPVPVVPEVEHGRDAVDLEILPSIDESKSYPRGSYASHRGGLWKSYERTHAMRGWECIVEGIDSVSVAQDSVREFTVTLSKSSGTEAVQKFTLPVQVYKGVHREGEEYEAHDTVTWGGSVWACKGATSAKPGASEDWVLAVKAGRAGKDLRENASTFDVSKGVKI